MPDRATVEVAFMHVMDVESLSKKLTDVVKDHPEAAHFEIRLHRQALVEMIRQLDKAHHLHSTVRDLVHAVHDHDPDDRGPESHP